MILTRTDIKQIKKPANVVLNYGYGRLIIESNGGFIAGLEIQYEGNINYAFTNELTKNTIADVGNNKILILNLTDYIIQGEIMHYKGYFKINSCIVVDANAKQIGSSLNFQRAKNKPEDMDIEPEAMDIEPEKMNKGYYFGKFRNKNKALVLKKQGKTQQRGQVTGPVTNINQTSGADK
jgi:hypothetical protein